MTDWITRIAEDFNYWGIAFLMFLENIFPPIPSEVVMPSAGYSASQGELSLFGVIVAGSIGSLAGVVPWYLLARWLGEDRLRRWVDRHGKWMTINQQDVSRANRWFERWGGLTVLVCRLVPGIRTLISVPAGFAEMNFFRFLLFSAGGTLGWSALLGWLGYYLGQNYTAVDRYVGWITITVIAALVIWYFARLYQQSNWRHQDASEAQV